MQSVTSIRCEPNEPTSSSTCGTARRSAGNHPSTITSKVGVLRGYFDFAQYDGMIPSNPAARVRGPRFFHDETRIVGLDRNELVAARHADPRTTTRYDRARLTLDRHATYAVAGYLTTGA